MAKEEVSPLALMEMRIEDDGVFRLPKVDGLPEDEDDALEYARIAWSQLDLAFYAACRGFAHYATAIRVRMGYLLATVQERFGPATYTTFREQIGIEKRTANNYKKLYEKRNHEFIMKLPPTKALRLIGALDKEGVELGDDKVKINIAGEWKEVGLEQATECTVSDFVALLDAHREGQKRIDAAEAEAKSNRDVYEKLLDDREEEIKKLRKRINRIETKERPDIEGLQEEARGHLNEVRRVLRQLMPNRGEYEVRCGMDVVLKEMGSIVETYGGEKLGRFYGEAEPGEEIDWPE